jgi:hypothetical protein
MNALTPSRNTHHETGDAYGKVIAAPCEGLRVIVCKDDLQWILQRRKKGGAGRLWRAVGYFRTRKALVRVCTAFCGVVAPFALAHLPETFTGGRK